MRPLRTHDSGIRRLDSLMCNIVFGALFIALGLGVLAFVATRTHMFHGALMRRQQQAQNNVWLLQQCQSAEFYSNMKQHSTLCDDVVLAQTDALWLHALRDVIEETYLCGEQPCVQRIEQGLQWVFGRGVLLLAALALGSLFLFLTVVHLQRTMHSSRYESLHPAAVAAWRQYPLLHDAHHEQDIRYRARDRLLLDS